MPAWGPEPGRASDSGDLGCGEGEGEEENHLRAGGMRTGTVSDGGSLGLSIRMSSSFGGVGGMMFVTGGCGCGVSRIGAAGISVRAAASIGGDGSSPSPDRSLLGRLGDDDDEANQARFFGTNLTSGSDRPALTDEGSEFGKLAGAPSDSGCSSGGGDGVAATFTVGWEAGWALAGCSLGGSGRACSASSFRGTLDEPRRDNDANHERGRGGAGGAGGVGVDIGPGVPGVAFVFVSTSVGSGSGAGGSPAPFVGE